MNLEVIAGLIAETNTLHREDQKWREQRADIVYQTPIAAQLAGSGTLDDSTALGPVAGYCWSIRRLYADGFTAGTVKILNNNIEPVALFTTVGEKLIPGGAIVLQPKDRLFIVASGITGSVNLWGAADAFPFWYLKEYLD